MTYRDAKPGAAEADTMGWRQQGGFERLSRRCEAADGTGSVRGANGPQGALCEAAERVWRRRRAGGGRRLRWRHVPCRLHGAVRRGGLCAPRLPEEIETRHRDAIEVVDHL